MIEGGPAISGCWINRNTNKIIEVRDFVMDGEKMLIIATDGSQVDGEDFSANYYQVSSSNKDALELQNSIKNTKPENMFDGLDDLVRENAPKVASKQDAPVNSVNTENPVITKLFEKQAPTLTVSADLTSIPKEALRTLIEYLGVSAEDLADYLCRHAVPDKEEIAKQIKHYVYV